MRACSPPSLTATAPSEPGPSTSPPPLVRSRCSRPSGALSFPDHLTATLDEVLAALIAETTTDAAGEPLPLPTHQVTHQLHLGGRFPDVVVNDVRDRLFAVIEAQRRGADDKHIAKLAADYVPNSGARLGVLVAEGWSPDRALAIPPGPSARFRWSSSWPSTPCTSSTTESRGSTTRPWPRATSDEARAAGPDGSLLHPRVLGRVGVSIGAPVVDGLETQLEVPGLVVVDLAQPVGGAVPGQPLGGSRSPRCRRRRPTRGRTARGETPSGPPPPRTRTGRPRPGAAAPGTPASANRC